MGCIIVKRNPNPSRKEYRELLKMKMFNGSYEEYVKQKQSASHEHPIIMCGNFKDIESCSDCIYVADYLCDYPVGKDKTCDRLMCHEHAKEISPDIHYCKTHYELWCEFKTSGGVKKELQNVVAFKEEK